MKPPHLYMLDILRSNKGFSAPEEWVDYALQHNFKKVQADKLETCPDCDARSSRLVGQFIYYSTLVKLQSCSDCGLIFVDTRIDSQVIQEHFENAYKDENYFHSKRRRVFDQLVNLINRAAPVNGLVLDIGGAKGHLMALLKEKRPDLKPVVNDLSSEACEYAGVTFGLETIAGDVRTLEQMGRRYDVIVMSDVAYYEPDLKRLWDLLPQLLKANGTVIMRIPNKLPLIRLWQSLMRLSGRSGHMQDRVKFFNPEHLYVFSRRYLERRLQKMGFSEVRFAPSELLTQGHAAIRYPMAYYCAQGMTRLSAGRLIVTPSLIVTASGCKNTAAASTRS